MAVRTCNFFENCSKANIQALAKQAQETLILVPWGLLKFIIPTRPVLILIIFTVFEQFSKKLQVLTAMLLFAHKYKFAYHAFSCILIDQKFVTMVTTQQFAKFQRSNA